MDEQLGLALFSMGKLAKTDDEKESSRAEKAASMEGRSQSKGKRDVRSARMGNKGKSMKLSRANAANRFED